MNTKTQPTFYVCRKLRLLSWLQEHGFNYMKTEPDKYDSSGQKVVWIFRYDSEGKLRQSIEDYYSSPQFINKTN